jgi:transcriptional regulator with XRE-family HTH domain
VIEFASTLRSARVASGLTQVELSERSGVARPNITAYESGRREPLFHSAVELLEAAGAEVVVEASVVWSWTEGRRPYAVPSRLWRLAPRRALGRFDPGAHLWWSGPPRSFDLAVREDRLRAYAIVLREGAPADIEQVVDGVLLYEAWADLVLPRELSAAWNPLIVSAIDDSIVRAAS